MNITKMSLVAALLVGSSAFAIENVKVSGDAKLYYSTNDAGSADRSDLLDVSTSAGQAAASLSVSADLTEGVSFGTKVTALTTMGLEGNLVSNVWEAPNGLSDSFIVNDFWLATTAGKTTAKVGRMELDTPLVFSEKWSIVANTFEAAVLINQDIPDTTLVGAYVGGSNGAWNTNAATVAGGGIGGVIAGEANNDTTFSQFHNGAFAVGAINNSLKPLTVQAWYYDAHQVTTASWIQADLNVDGILVGAQYSGIDHGQAAAGDVYALMLGYSMKDTFTAKVAYSQTGKDATAGFNLTGTNQSKLYTEAWWNYGYATRADTSTVNVTIEATVAEIDLGVYGTQSAVNNGGNMNEGTFTATKAMGPVDATLAYIYSNAAGAGALLPDYSNTIQAYLTYNF